MTITIVQGNDHSLPFSDIHIVIDVIRAFTVAHYAFLNGAKKILLVQTAEEALKLKESHPDYLLMEKNMGLRLKDLISTTLRNALPPPMYAIKYWFKKPLMESKLLYVP